MTSTTVFSTRPVDAIGKWIPCRIEVLTPVHVGSGVKWREGFDFIVDDYGTYVIPEALLLEYLESYPERISDVADDQKRVELLGEIEGGIEYDLPCEGRDLLSFIRNGHGEPILPGSSLKGGLRTMLFWTFWKQVPKEKRKSLLKEVVRSRRPRKEWAAQPLLKHVLGKNPNYDIMRALSVADISLSQENLELRRVHVLSLTSTNGTSYGWKNLRTGHKEKDFRRSTPIYAEMIKPGTEVYGALRLDRFLLEDQQAERVLGFKKYGLTRSQIATWANVYAKRRLERERDFLEKCDDGQLFFVLEEHKKLLTEVEEASSNAEQSTFLLRLGWGSGWQSMTGDYLEGDILNQIRRIFGLGKRGFPIFPKTRKIVFDGDRPAFLSGWVKITLNVSPPAEHTESGRTSVAVSKVPEAEAPSPATEIVGEPITQIPEGYRTGVIRIVNINKGFGKVQPEEGGESLKFNLTLAPGLNKGVRVMFKVEAGQVVDIKPLG